MTIQFDDQGFGTDAHRIRWEEVVAIGIRTTAEGPFLEDLFWQFLLRDGFLELPGAWIDGAALAVMQKQLTGMDSLKIIRAVGSTNERVFRVWHCEESRWQWDDAVFGARFAQLVGRLGGDMSRAEDAFRRLRVAWSAKERRYHDLEHLVDCLRELGETRAAPDLADMAELALWYHDAVYEPLARDNEERSAALLCADAATLGIPHERASAAATCVRATAHLAGVTASGPASDLVVDIDLSILGRDGLRFLELEFGVEEEYAKISRTRYFVGRGHFLAALLASPSIFRTRHFRERYEASARSNISALLKSPRYRPHRWFGRFCRTRKRA